MSSFLRDLEPLRPSVDWPLLQKQRLERTTKLMKEFDLDALLVNSFENVIYLTNWPRWYFETLFAGVFSALYIQGGEEAVAFCLQADAKHVIKRKLFKDIRPLESSNRYWIKEWGKAISDYSLENKRIGLDPRIPGIIYERVKKEIPNVTFVDASPLLNKLRMVKNAEELKAYEYTIALIEAGYYAGIKMAKDSWGRYSELDIAAEANSIIMRKGATRCNFWCTSGDNASITMRYPTERLIRGREIVLLDGGGSFNGLRAEFARSIWTGGTPSTEQKRIYSLLFQIHKEVQKIIKPGLPTKRLDELIRSMVAEAGYKDFYGGYPYTGHGIGITSEPPYITMDFPEHFLVLEEGMLFNLEPAIWKEGVGGIRVEDTYLVTADGNRVISRAPYEQELLES